MYVCCGSQLAQLQPVGWYLKLWVGQENMAQVGREYYSPTLKKAVPFKPSVAKASDAGSHREQCREPQRAKQSISEAERPQGEAC